MKRLAHVSIFVEGAEDSRFLQEVIQKWYHIKVSRPESSTQEANRNDSEKMPEIREQAGEQTDILHIGGKTKIAKAIQAFQENNANGLQNILFLDADSVQKDEQWGGVRNTRAYLNHIRDVHKIVIDKAYIFPNCTEVERDDEDTEGDLETILEHIAVEKTLLSCWDGYVSCIAQSAVSEKKMYKAPGSKTKFYAYTEAVLRNADDAGGSRRKYQNAFWNLDPNIAQLGGLRYLNPLKDFLDTIISNQT